MTRKFRIEAVDNKIEEDIIIGLIVFDKVCNKLMPIAKQDYFVSSQAKEIFKWIHNYFSLYNEAPRKHIQDIFENEKKKLDASTVELIEIILSKLSEEFESENFNVDYLIDRALEYIDKRSLTILSNDIDTLVANGRLDDAKIKVSNYRKIVKVTSSWIDPFNYVEVNSAMNIESETLFSFPGELGKMVGGFERDQFIAFLAPVKRGKTWILIELAILALMNKLKVVFISLEMNDARVKRRVYKRISSCVSGGGLVRYPCFDCLNNQDGSCLRIERTNKIRLLDNNDEVPNFHVNMKYKPCSYCKDNNIDAYIPTSWFTVVERPDFNISNIRAPVKAFRKMFAKNNFRFKAYPRFSAGIDNIKGDLDILGYSEGFFPDVIITDYIDIIAREKGEVRHEIDKLWMLHAALATERHCLVATASQAKASSWNSRTVTAADSSENYRNPAHVDAMFSLNQTNEEKEKGLMRIAFIAAREGYFNAFRQVTVLQQLNAGQPIIDSFITGPNIVA